jgi:hypothetical protein
VPLAALFGSWGPEALLRFGAKRNTMMLHPVPFDEEETV